VAINHVDAAQKEAAESDRRGRSTCRAPRASAVEGDVTKDADCVRMVERTMDKFGRLDALVNAAGISKMVAHPDLHGVSAEDFQRIYAVNTIGTFQMMRAAAPHLKASGKGSIVNISSRAALMGSGSSIPYAASKAAVNALTLALARVLAPEVRVNAVCPALVEQGFVERLAPESFASGAHTRSTCRRCTASATPTKWPRRSGGSPPAHR
jgi:3-oxoacyl-[acyl-carrier protein] reductase